MNLDCHRIVFNKRRGQLMAVAETAQSGGKTAAGEFGRNTWHTLLGIYRSLAVAMWLIVGTLPVAWAQIISDPTAPANQRPTVLSSSSGQPLVNIQTPSSAGLSRNTYKQFDVSTKGIILNNSASNPWLSNGVLAKTILNEVNSTSQSYIKGYISVKGAAAQVIVANQSGITVNGGSFFNANRATLTTGTAKITNGALTGFDIRGGAVTVGSSGFSNSSTPYTDIMSRVVSVVGKLQAQKIGITTGLQTVDYSTRSISNQDTNIYAAGALAIDTAALGGMYSGNISILATEAGLGVRNQGAWQAMGNQIVVTANGLLQNLGTVSAGSISLTTVKGNIENTGSLQGTQAVVTSSGGDTHLFGAGLKQTAGSSVVISAKGAVNLYNHDKYGTAQVASTATGGQVSIRAGQNINVNSGTSIASSGDVQLSSDAMVLGNGASITSSNGNITALAGTGLDLSNSTVTGQQVHLETGAAFKDTASSLVVRGGTVSGKTQTTLIATDSIQISSASSTAVSGGGNVHIQATKAVNITAGSTVAADQHMSVIAGTALNLQATSGATATDGQKVTLSAGGNMLVSGNSVTATGSKLSAGQDLDIEANDGNANLQALSNVSGTSVDHVNLSAGKDLNVSAFKGSLWATGVQAIGQNVAFLSNGTTSVANATVRNGTRTQAVASTLSAYDDLTVGSINTTSGVSSQVQMVASSFNAGGQAKILSNGLALITATTDTVNGVTSPSRSSITAGSVTIQGGSLQTDAADIRTNGDKSTTAKSGDITITTTGNALFNIHTGYRTQLNSTGNIVLLAQGNLTHWYTQANAGGSLSSTSATGQINGTGANLVVKDVLSFASNGSQTHTNGFYSGGAASVYNETGNLALNSTRVQAVGTTTSGMASMSGQTSIESGSTLGLDANSVLVGTTDLSIIQGQGDILINPSNAERGTLSWNQIGMNRNLTLVTRNGNINFTGSAGTNGMGSSNNVGLYVKGDFNLIGNNVNLQGSRLQAGGALSITATAGDVNTTALQVDQTAAGYTNTYWDSVQLVGTTGVNVRAAGNIAMDSVYVQTNSAANIQSGGNTTIAGKYGHYAINDQPVGGWYQDERSLWRSTINGQKGVNIGAMGGTLTLSATDLYAGAGKASLQALGHINLEAAQESRLHETYRSGNDRSCFLLFCKNTSWVDYYHNEYLLNKPVTITAQDIEVKAGNDINIYGTKFSASRNLTLEAGDYTNYYAVYDQKIETAKRDSKTGWGIGNLFSIRVGNNSTTNSTFKLSGQPTILQSLGDILSNSGSDQLLQGTLVSYGGTAAFNTGVGDKARADARLILESIKNSTTQTRTSQSNYVLWQSMVNSGTKSETLVLPTFSGPTKPTFTAPGGLSVQIQDGNFKSQVVTLSAQPGMGYLNDLVTRKDVNWQPVKLAYDSWNYQQSGLTPAGAALVAVTVAWATGGTGAGLVGAADGTMSAAMANAAFSSLAAQASITLINNKGDVSKTLKELGSSQTVKATLTSMLTAGVLEQLGATSTMKDLSGQTGFSEKLTYNLINATGRALTNTAINGGNLEEALKQALVGGIVDTVHGQAASAIKVLESDYLVHKLAHALAGCIAGEAAGGACKDGAIGAAVGEIVVGILEEQKPSATATREQIDFYTNKILAYSKLIAGAVAAYSGGNSQTAITAAETAVKNNGLFEFLFPRNLPKKTFIGRDISNNPTEKTATIDAERQRITLIQPGENDLYAAGTGGNQVDGYTIIFAHASNNSIQGVNPVNKSEWYNFVNMIKNSGAWKPGQPIILDACNTGMFDNGVASELAKSLNTKVIGASTATWNIPSYSTSVFSGSYEKLTIANPIKSFDIPNLTSPGLWKTFASNGTLISTTTKKPY